MTIDRLGDKTILVTLMRDDMRRYDLNFEEAADEVTTRSGLTRLMYRVGEECGLSHRDKSYLIEALPGRESCLLIISVRINKPRRKYRIKRERYAEICRFDDADAYLDWRERSADPRLRYTLYRMDSCYYLLPVYPLSAADSGALNEYGTLTREDPVTAARIREYGTLIGEHTGHRRYFRYSSSDAI